MAGKIDSRGSRSGLLRRLDAGHAMAAAGLAALVFLMLLSWCQPLIDGMHGFRQTQTALSAYWLSRGSDWLAYETPVLGAPWSIPFEFPLYQWIVAAFHGDGSLERLDHAGRLVNAAFFLASGLLVHRTARVVSGDRVLAWACAGAFLISPLLLFWSRGVMIESTAVFLGLAFVHASARRWTGGGAGWLMVALLAATLAALVKITTFFGFAVLVGSAMAVHVVVSQAGTPRRAALVRMLEAGVVVLFALAALKGWLWFSDALKQQTLWGDSLTSERLSPWNFGTWAQRTDPAFWTDVVFGRALHDSIGVAWIAFLAFAIVLLDRRLRVAGVLLALAYIAPYLVFTNLHAVHDYYQYANAPFVAVIAGLAVRAAAGWPKVGAWGGVAVALLLLAASAHRLATHYLPQVQADATVKREWVLAEYLGRHVSQDAGLVIVGLGWDSTLPYYARRRAFFLPDWQWPSAFEGALDQRRILGDVPLGAFVVCPNGLSSDPEKAGVYARLLERYTRQARLERVADCEVYLHQQDNVVPSTPPTRHRICPVQDQGNAMNATYSVRALLACAIGIGSAGCDREAALPPSNATPAAETAATPAPVPAGPSDTQLRAGLAILSTRVAETHDAFAKIEPKQDARYFMHPAVDKAATLVFDTSGLTSLQLSPAIGMLDANCRSMPDAGVVGFSWQVDDQPAHALTVDRNYRGTIEVPLQGSKRLTLKADAGNGVIWCDWFGVGAFDVVGG